MESEAKYQTKKTATHVPRGMLKKLALELGEKYSTIAGKWQRRDPKIENLVLRELEKQNRIRVENYELKKQIKTHEMKIIMEQ